jgi:large subunit ribosomal protein L25
MANELTILKAEARAESGSAASGRLRRTGYIPAAVTRINGGSTLLKINAREFGALLRAHGEQQQLLSLDVQGTPLPAMLREIQYHPLTGLPINADFGEVDLTRKVRIRIPLYISGDPVGVKIGGGILQQLLHTIEVDCLPTDIVESFTVDVSSLELDASLFVKDLQLGDKYTIVTGKGLVVARVAAPEEDGNGAAGDGTPEVITKGKKDDAKK